jgi:hypothetical protein
VTLPIRFQLPVRVQLPARFRFVRSFAAFAAAAAVALPPNAGAAAESASPSPDLGHAILDTATDPGTSKETQTAGPLLDPRAADVDATHVVAVAKPGVKTTQARRQATAALKGRTPGSIQVAGSAGNAQMVVVAAPAGESDKVAEDLVASGLYEAVDYDVVRRTHAGTVTPNDPLFTSASAHTYGLKSGLGGSNFDEAWASATGRNGTWDAAPVAVLDSGFGLDHPDLGDNVVSAWDYGEGDADVSPALMDPDHDHGAQTASVVGARADNAIGSLGAAWNNKVLAFRVANSRGEITSSLEIAGLLGAVDAGAKVISLSFGGPRASSAEQAAIRRAYAADITVVASAGNDGEEVVEGVLNPVNYPAAYPEVISVGSTDIAGLPSAFSSYNSQVDLAGAGEQVLVASDAFPSQYGVADGTSFSAPLIAAAAALVLRERPGLSPTQVATVLCETAVDVVRAPATPGRDPYTGCGIVNARAALERARSIPLYPTVALPVPETTLTAGETLGVPITVDSYPEATLTVDPATLLPAGVTLARSGGQWLLAGNPTAAGDYPVTVVATSAGRATGATAVIHVRPAAPAQYTLHVPAAMRASTRLTPTLTAIDAYGNGVPVPEVSFTYSIKPQCRFTKRSKQSYRRCTVHAQTPSGRVASAKIDVYDTSRFTKPKVTGTVKPGRKIKASIPAGWRHLSYQWYKNGHAIKGAKARVYKIPKSATTKASYRVKVTIKQVASKTSRAVKVRK